MKKMELSSLKVTFNKNIAIHRDPHSPAPAGIFGRGIYDGQSVHWERGGNLVIVDGMLRIDRGPRDFVLMNGNLCHAVSNLRCTHKYEKGKAPSRFSMILFSSHQRERLKAPGNYKIDFSYANELV